MSESDTIDGQSIQELLDSKRLSPAHAASYLNERHALSVRADSMRKWLASGVSPFPAEVTKRIMEILLALPDPPQTTGGFSKKAEVEITDQMREQLNAEFERTGLKVTALFRLSGCPHPKLTPAKISNWRTGRNRDAQGTHWAYVIDLLAKYPDKRS